MYVFDAYAIYDTFFCMDLLKYLIGSAGTWDSADTEDTLHRRLAHAVTV